MSAPASPSAAAQPAAGPPAASEACPLCGAPLAPDQEWCLSCGAAARTRLAGAPNWRGPLIAVAVIAALALGVLAAALVKLAGDSGPPPAPTTRTITSPALVPAPTATTPPATTTPPAGTATTPTTPGQTTTPPTGGAGTTTTPATPAPGTGGTATTPTTSHGKGALGGLAPQTQK